MLQFLFWLLCLAIAVPKMLQFELKCKTFNLLKVVQRGQRSGLKRLGKGAELAEGKAKKVPKKSA